MENSTKVIIAFAIWPAVLWLCWLYFNLFFHVWSEAHQFPANLPAYAVNEQLQDVIDKNWGLDDMLNNIINEDVPAKNIHFLSGNELVYDIRDASPIINEKGRYGLRVYHADTPPPYSSEITAWNRSTYVHAPMTNVMEGVFKLIIFSLGGLILLPVICFVSRFGFMYGCLGKVYAYTFLIFSVILLYAYWINLPKSRDYTDTHTELLPLVKSNLLELRSVLDSADHSGLYTAQFLEKAGFAYVEPENLLLFPKSPQERNICGSYIFVSDGVSMPHKYVRINVDAYTYLFWAPEMSEEEVSALNENITFQYMGDDIWLGKYDARIGDIYRIILWFRLSLMALVLIALFSAYCLWNENFRPKLKARQRAKARELADSQWLP